MPPVPPPLGLPPPQRKIRALRRTAQWIAISVAIVIVVIVFYGITHMGGHGGGSSEEAKADANKTAPATPEVLLNAPQGSEIRARRKPALIPAKVTATSAPVVVPTTPAAAATPDPTPPPPPPVDDDMTEAAIAGRKAAWQAYYQQLADTQAHRLEARRVSMSADTEPTPVAVATGGGGPTAGGSLPGAPQDKAPTNFFTANASNPATDYSPFTLTNPISPYELKATDVITAKLVSSVNSDSPGIIKAMVTKSVMDHATGMHILVPQGATLEGVYDTTVAYGQTRVVTAWTRVIYPSPCDQSLDLGAMPGSDQSGQAGFEDLTDNHLLKIFTSAILVSVFSAGAQLSQPQQSSVLQTYSPVQQAAGTVGQQTSQLGAEFARRGLSIPPTERVRNGYPFTVMLTKDIPFVKPWVEGVCDQIEVASR
ncbi:MAG: TrbI/VirB10 family protein [Rhodopila sp.]|jgi:type IV secretion system protein VirB10